jgi:predicted O-methyltransferase YrrM
LDFETLYKERVEKCSHETAFNKEEARALFNLAYEIPACSNILEVGVEYGRSTAVLGTVAAERGHQFCAVDPIIQDHVREHHINLWRLPIILDAMTSQEAAVLHNLSTPFYNLIHIDGSHEYEDVLFDCHAWAPRVVPGGFICFDDYGHPGLEGVKKAVDEYFSVNPDWRFVDMYGHKLIVFKRNIA